MEMALGIDFSWIFIDFGMQVGAKLALKINQKSIQKNIKKMMRKKNILTRLSRSAKRPRAVGPPQRNLPISQLSPTQLNTHPPFSTLPSSGERPDAPDSIFEIPSLSLRS